MAEKDKKEDQKQTEQSAKDTQQKSQSEDERPSEETSAKSNQDEERAALVERLSRVKNVDRILDINLELAVKIGELRMMLKDVLELHSGSIIEIEKNADEPLDLEIGKKVIAQGEVVTVGENLGLRVIRKK